MYFEKKISATMRERKHFDCALELKSLDEHGRFAGYASVFNVVDNQRDVMLRGAFLPSLLKGAASIKFLWQHHQEEPIGVVTQLSEDAHGLHVQGKLLLNVQRAREAYALLKAGAISGLSIGYSPIRYAIDPESGIRLLSEVELWEISLVTFPANSNANITMVKADLMPMEDDNEEWRQAQSTGGLAKLSEALDYATALLKGY